MTSGEEEQKKREGNGFAGISSLVSDVDITPPPAAKTKPVAAGPNTGRRTSQAAQSQPSQPHQTYQDPAQPPSSGSSGGKWVLGIAVVIGVLWLIGQSDKRPTSQAPAYSPPAQTLTPSYAPPAEPQAPSRPQVSMPPIGQELVFSTPQIRYCLAEAISLEGAKSAVNNDIDTDVDRFNAMVADYNSRCGNFRYRRGALESAQRDIEPYQSQLQSEGRSRFASSPSTSSMSTPATSDSAPDATVQAIQRKVNAAPALASSLQEESRPATASMQLSSVETDSLEAACSTDKYVNGPAAYRACVGRQKAALAAGVRRPNLNALSSAEQQSLEAACSTDKYVNGPAAYNQCLSGQLAAMSGEGSRRPNLSRLSNSERQSIEAACSTDKYVNGPAAYNRCLNTQLAALDQQGGRPDLSGLSTADRSSIESACSTDKYVNGPAAYNRCLSQQLARLR